MLESMLSGKGYRLPTPSKFNGEIPSAEFIDGDTLAVAVGLAGSSYNSTSPWLSFTYKEKSLFVPKLPLRNNISWRMLYQAGIVHGTDDAGTRPSGLAAVIQDKRVVIGNKTYRVRLMKGSNGSALSSSGRDLAYTRDSEFSDLMYPIVIDSFAASYTGGKISNPYQLADLGYLAANSTASQKVCQEITSSNFLYRGSGGTNPSTSISSVGAGYTTVSPNLGWLPCLELVP